MAISELTETRIVGEDTHQIVVHSEMCPALNALNIAHVAVSDAADPYRIVRTKLSGAFLLGTISDAKAGCY